MSGNHHDSHQTGTESYAALRTRALESLLVEKGLITTDVTAQRRQSRGTCLG
jgi:hypothetical protein